MKRWVYWLVAILLVGTGASVAIAGNYCIETVTAFTVSPGVTSKGALGVTSKFTLQCPHQNPTGVDSCTFYQYVEILYRYKTSENLYIARTLGAQRIGLGCQMPNTNGVMTPPNKVFDQAYIDNQNTCTSSFGNPVTIQVILSWGEQGLCPNCGPKITRTVKVSCPFRTIPAN